MTRLIIAEKPDMGKKIASALNGPHKSGNGFIETSEGIVSWCIGHVLEMLKPEEYNAEWGKWRWENLPMIPEKWNLKVCSDKEKQFKILKELIKNSSDIINAGDPGREGQLIVDELLHYLNNKKSVKRLLLPALDKVSIRNAMNSLQDNNNFFPLYQAGLARGYADWLTGLNGTQAFTLLGQKKGYKGVLSVGRVQSPTLAIVVANDEIIENFIPRDYFIVTGDFLPIKNNKNFKAYWKANPNTDKNILDEEKRIKDKSYAYNLIGKLNGKPAKVINFIEENKKEYAPLPFSLSKLQIYASSKWSMTAKDVLDTCQALYEKHELQSYPRTDCQYLPTILIGEAPNILNHISKSQPNLLNAVNGANTQLKSAAWDDSKLGEHYGLIPTNKQADLSQLNDKEKKIYQAVCERYIAQFYPPCLFKTAIVDIECETELFKANGKVITNLGWRAVFKGIDDDDDNTNNDSEEQVFPELAIGDDFTCQKTEVIEKKTQPPSRFDDGSLIKAMANVHTLVSDPAMKQKLKDKKGIGQEATRTQVIEKLIKISFLKREGKQLISTEPARALIKSLPKKIIDPAMTAIWEDGLDKIASGSITLDNFMAKQIIWVNQLITDAKQTNINIIASPVNYSNSSSNSSNSKTSNNTTSKSKGSSSYNTTKPAFKSNNSNNGPKLTVATNVGDTCPQCKKGSIVQREAKATGKKFKVCSDWKNCNFVDWS